MLLVKAKKLNMSQLFLEDGTVVPITWTSVEEPSNFVEGSIVKVSGTSKGKGFTGVIKRHGFSRGPKTHGQSDRERAPGSIGSGTTVSRVYKGKKMAGKHGNKKVTVKDVKVMKVKASQVALSGPLPGHFGAEVKIYIDKE